MTASLGGRFDTRDRSSVPVSEFKGAGTNVKVVGHVSIRREALEKIFFIVPPTFYTVPP